MKNSRHLLLEVNAVIEEGLSIGQSNTLTALYESESLDFIRLDYGCRVVQPKTPLLLVDASA